VDCLTDATRESSNHALETTQSRDCREVEIVNDVDSLGVGCERVGDACWMKVSVRGCPALHELRDAVKHDESSWALGKTQ
jgi:hypothetical protein